MAETQDISVSSAWVQVSDGGAHVTVQPVTGTIYARSSASAPSLAARGHIADASTIVECWPGETVWIRSAVTDEVAAVVVT